MRTTRRGKIYEDEEFYIKCGVFESDVLNLNVPDPTGNINYRNYSKIDLPDRRKIYSSDLWVFDRIPKDDYPFFDISVRLVVTPELIERFPQIFNEVYKKSIDEPGYEDFDSFTDKLKMSVFLTYRYDTFDDGNFDKVYLSFQAFPDSSNWRTLDPAPDAFHSKYSMAKLVSYPNDTKDHDRILIDQRFNWNQPKRLMYKNAITEDKTYKYPIPCSYFEITDYLTKEERTELGQTLEHTSYVLADLTDKTPCDPLFSSFYNGNVPLWAALQRSLSKRAKELMDISLSVMPFQEYADAAFVYTHHKAPDTKTGHTDFCCQPIIRMAEDFDKHCYYIKMFILLSIPDYSAMFADSKIRLSKNMEDFIHNAFKSRLDPKLAVRTIEQCSIDDIFEYEDRRNMGKCSVKYHPSGEPYIDFTSMYNSRPAPTPDMAANPKVQCAPDMKTFSNKSVPVHSETETVPEDSADALMKRLNISEQDL